MRFFTIAALVLCFHFAYSQSNERNHIQPIKKAELNSYSKKKVSCVSKEIPEDYPKYKDTGNPKADEENYAQKKKEWIEKNPEKYKEIVSTKPSEKNQNKQKAKEPKVK